MASPSPHPRPRIVRFVVLAAAIALAAAVVPAWRATFDWLVARGTVERWANPRPERLQVQWSSIRSPWPGWIELEGLRVAGRSSRMLWEITADRASGAWQPHRLPLRELAWSGVRGEGVELRVARFPRPGVRAPDPAQLPVIEGFPDGPAPELGRRPAWSFGFRGVALDGIREVWIDDRRSRVRGSGRGGLVLRRRTTAEVLDTEIGFERLDLQAGGREVASAVSGRARFRIRRYPYRGVTLPEVARRFDGRIELAGTIEPDEVLSYLFGGWDRLEIESRPSRVEATVVLEGERLRPGSLVRISSPRHAVRFLGFEATGDAELEARAVGDFGGVRLESSLALGAWEMGRPGEPPLLAGRGMRLEATARAARVDQPPHAAALRLDLGDARLPDLTFLNDLIPEAAGIAVEDGSASVGGEVRLAADAGGQDGNLVIRGSDLALRVGDQRMSADLEARIRLADPDLSEAAFSLDGTRVFLRDFSADTSAGDRVSGWWGEIGLARGRIRLERPARIEASFDARLRDTRPLVAFYGIYRDLPRWTERLLTLEAVSISGDLDWSPGRLRVDNGFLPLAHGELRGEVELEGDVKRGRMFASWRDIAVGLELDGPRRDLHLIGARDWWRECCSGTSPAP